MENFYHSYQKQNLYIWVAYHGNSQDGLHKCNEGEITWMMWVWLDSMCWLCGLSFFSALTSLQFFWKIWKINELLRKSLVFCFSKLFSCHLHICLKLNPLDANPQNCQTHLKNLLAFANKLFKCIWPFCGVGA